MIELILLSIITWITYIGVINCGFVSDDIEGLQNYDGKLKKFDWGHLNKWLLLKLLGKDNRTNHSFSILIHNANVILLYAFLVTFLPQKVAFYTSILFAVHPVCVQAIGWISGRGYPLSLFFALINFNLVVMVAQAQFMGNLPLKSAFLALTTVVYGGLYYLAIQAQFATLSTFVVQSFLGNYFLGIIGLLISIVTGLGIIREVIKIRTDTFKAQNLAHSTKFNPRKVIVAFKTLAYYTKLAIFPKRLGLYHTFEYHYSEATEKENRWFWLGFVILLAFIGLFWYGNQAIRFGIIWYFSYIFIFLNWITIHQFVSERYLYIASVGICILIASLLSLIDNLFFGGYPVTIALIGGLYLMRTWVHLPTYQDEVQFYQSNIWNFPNSEVAFSNLGVVYMKCQLIGSAVDMWMISTNINKDYDVAYYNISSVFRQQGQLTKARGFLESAVNCKSCHFKELWTKELQDLDNEINYAVEVEKLYKRILEAEKIPENRQQGENLRKQLDQINNLHKIFEENQKKQLTLIEQEENGIKLRLTQIQKIKEDAGKPIDVNKIKESRDMNFKLVKETADRLFTTGSNESIKS